VRCKTYDIPLCKNRANAWRVLEASPTTTRPQHRISQLHHRYFLIVAKKALLENSPPPSNNSSFNIFIAILLRINTRWPDSYKKKIE
jgi:hypothetical protein